MAGNNIDGFLQKLTKIPEGIREIPSAYTFLTNRDPKDLNGLQLAKLEAYHSYGPYANPLLIGLEARRIATTNSNDYPQLKLNTGELKERFFQDNDYML